MAKMLKSILCLILLWTATLTACQDKADIVGNTSTLERPPVENNITDDPTTILTEYLIGQWDILRFDDFMPKSRLDGEGKRSAYVDFYDNNTSSTPLSTSFNIGCNYTGNDVRLDPVDNVHKMIPILGAHGRTTTDMGCPGYLGQRDKLFFSIMDQPLNIERLGEHRLRLWEGDHELILEKAEISQARNLIRNFETIEGEWEIILAARSGAGFGGQFYVPEPFVISKDKIQYGNLIPYLKNPIIAPDGKIDGELTGDFTAGECGRLLSPDNQPLFTEENAICFVLNTIASHPIAEPIVLPDYLQLTSGEYRITLQRAGR